MAQPEMTTLSSADQEIIMKWQETVTASEPIRVGLAASDDPQGAMFSAFCDDLKALVPRINVKREDLREDGIPFFKISDHIRYRCIPREKELLLFLDLLSGVDFSPPTANAPLAENIASIAAPAFLKIYIATLCPFCPKAVSDLLWLAGQSRRIHITVIDGELFPVLAEQDRIRSVPTVILDDDLRWVGQVNLGEIVGMMVERDPSRLGRDALRAMIEEGGAGRLAEMMAGSHTVFPALIDLLAHPLWSVRLGAMAVFEYLVDIAEALADQLLDLLWERFENVDDSVKGDILYLIGQSRHFRAAERLAAVAAGPYAEDVVDAAEEALEALRSKDESDDDAGSD
jgi:thiol-disulfide isomerase/thioredoxin